jgi:pyrroloquinoline quinone (PQQ) biosynthesis protein C
MEEFIKTVKAMRQLQADYFRTRSQDILRKAREAEKKVDDMIREMEKAKTPQKRLDF